MVFDTEKCMMTVYFYKLGQFVKNQGKYEHKGGLIYSLVEQEISYPTYYTINLGNEKDAFIDRTIILGLQSGVNYDLQLVSGEFVLEKEESESSARSAVVGGSPIPDYIALHLYGKRVVVKKSVVEKEVNFSGYKDSETLQKIAGIYIGYFMSPRQKIFVGEMSLSLKGSGAAEYTERASQSPNTGRVTLGENNLIYIEFTKPRLFITLYIHEAMMIGTYGGLGTDNIPAAGRIYFRKISTMDENVKYTLKRYKTKDEVNKFFEKEPDLFPFFTGQGQDKFADDPHILFKDLTNSLYSNNKTNYKVWAGTYEEFYIDPVPENHHQGKIIKNIITIQENGEATYKSVRGGEAIRGIVKTVLQNHIIRISFDYEENYKDYRFELILRGDIIKQNGKETMEGVFFGRKFANNNPIAGKVLLNRLPPENADASTPHFYDFNKDLEALNQRNPDLISFFLGEHNRNYIPTYHFFKRAGILPKSFSSSKDIQVVYGDYLSFRLGVHNCIEVNPVRITKTGEVYFKSSSSGVYKGVAEVYLDSRMLAVTTFEKDGKPYHAQSLFPLSDESEATPFLYGLSLNHTQHQRIRAGREVWIKSAKKYEEEQSEKIKIPFKSLEIKEEDSRFHEYQKMYYHVMSFLASSDNNIEVQLNNIPNSLSRNYEQAVAYFYTAYYKHQNGDTISAAEYLDKAEKYGLYFDKNIEPLLAQLLKNGRFADNPPL